MTARLYTRVSTLNQSADGFSMAAQESKARAWCAYQGIGEVVLYPEPAVSGRRDDRPQLAALLSDLTAGDVVIVYALARLGRGGAVQLLGILKTIREKGARLVSLTEQIDTETPTGRLMITLMAALAELEVELMRERTEFGRLQAASQGIFPHAPDALPTGWTTDEEGRIVEDEYSDTVRAIIRRGRAKYNATATWLKEQRIPAPRGGTWAVPQVRRIVMFKGYHTGVLEYRKTALPDAPGAWIDIPAPALVTEAEWKAAQRSASSNNAWSRPDRFPLTGHLRCVCGARVYGRARTSKNPNHIRPDAYVCQRHGRDTEFCASNGKRIRLWGPTDRIHAEARAALARYLLDPSDPAHLHGAPKLPPLDPHKEDREAITGKLAALVDLLLSGLIDREAYEVRHAALTAQRKALQAPTPAPLPESADLSHLEPVVLGCSNEELALLLDGLGVQFEMTAGVSVQLLSVQGLRQA